MLISYVFIDRKVKGIYFISRSASRDCLARQSISIDVLYNREFKSDDKVPGFAIQVSGRGGNGPPP